MIPHMIQAAANALACFIVVAAAAAPALAQPTFTAMGDLPGGSFHSEAWGLSADGSTVSGASIISGNLPFSPKYAAFAWRAETGLIDIYHLEGIGTICRAYAANGNGTTIVGSADYNCVGCTHIVAFVWTSETGAIEIGDLDGGQVRGGARAVSFDGQIIAGQGDSDNGNEAFLYSAGFFLGLSDLPGGIFSSDALGISADGITIVGSSSSTDGVQACRWVLETDALNGLGFLPTPEPYQKFSEAYATSADGSVIVGLSRSNNSVSTGGWEAFRWTAAGGMQPLGDLPGGAVLSVGYAVSADGSVVVGRAGVLGNCTPFGCQTAGRAFIWDHQHGLRDLKVVLVGMGLNLGAWELSEARGLSADGRVIAGSGINPLGNFEAWRVDLGPAVNAADINEDGAVNVTDLLAVINGWGACPAMPAACPGDCAPPRNGDGTVNVIDLLMIINNWG